MHTCPDCGEACYCNGDIEDHDTGEPEDCGHNCDPDPESDFDNEYFEDDDD